MTSTDVLLVRWPEDGDDGSRLAQKGLPVLYLIDDDANPPTITTCLEDWVRVPSDERDLLARMAALQARTVTHLAPPSVDSDGRVHYRGKLVLLPADTVEVAAALTSRFEEVVPDEELPLPTGDLRSAVTRLRTSLRDLGLTVRRVRRKGYCLQAR